MRILLFCLAAMLALPLVGCSDQVCIQPKAGATTCPSQAEAEALVRQAECVKLEDDAALSDGACCYSVTRDANWYECYGE